MKKIKTQTKDSNFDNKVKQHCEFSISIKSILTLKLRHQQKGLYSKFKLVFEIIRTYPIKTDACF